MDNQILKTLEEMLNAIKDMQSKMVTKEESKDFATKDNLKGSATKDDLKGFATKHDLKNFATKDDLKVLRKQIKEDIDHAAMGVFRSADKAKADRREVKELERRVDKIERIVNAS